MAEGEPDASEAGRAQSTEICSDWLTEDICQQIVCMLQRPNDDDSERFRVANRKKLYKGGKLSLPFFCLGDVNNKTILCRISYTHGRVETRQVVSMSQAHHIVTNLHKDVSSNTCKPGGINALVGQFTMTYYYKGIRAIVENVLKECNGTCKLSKHINTVPPPPKAMRTTNVMEVIQCDLIYIMCGKGLPSSEKHDFKYILSVKDCFSKFCWLFPLKSKEALPVTQCLKTIFNQYGPPKYLHTDNGKEFVNESIHKLCCDMGINIKKGRPYHPQSQGQVEVLNKRIKSTLAHFLQKYENDIQCDVWPLILKDVTSHINNTWHYTIRNTPFNVFMGRHNKVEYNCNATTLFADGCMPEDFLFSDGDESNNPFVMELGTDYDAPFFNSYPQTLFENDITGIADMENMGSLTNKLAFEATEATIFKNHRAHLPKVKLPTFDVGNEVLFKNPHHTSSLTTTLNIHGVITNKISRNVYEVQGITDEQKYVLYRSEIVHWNDNYPGKKSPDTTNDEECTPVCISRKDIIDQIRVFANMCRNDVMKKSYGCVSDEIQHSLEEILDDVGIGVLDLQIADDLMNIFYVSMDCLFLYKTTADDEFKKKCLSYASLLTKILKEHHFSMYLSGIYFWETVRSHTIDLLYDAVLMNYIPILHQCAECIGSGCKHPCCRSWFIMTGIKIGVLEKKGDDTITVTAKHQVISRSLLCKESPHGQLDITDPIKSDSEAENISMSTNRRGKKEKPQDKILKRREKPKKKSKARLSNVHSSTVNKCVTRKQKRRAKLRSSMVYSSGNTSTGTKKVKKQRKKASLTTSNLCKNTPNREQKLKLGFKTNYPKTNLISVKYTAETNRLSRLATLQRSKYHKVPHLTPLPLSQNKNISMRALNTMLESARKNIQNKSFSKEMLADVCSLATETLNLKVYRSLEREQKFNLSNNVKYMRDIIGTPSTGATFLHQQSTPEMPFFQSQGSSSLCGLCALNNLVGREEFITVNLDSISDDIWFQQISDGLSLIDELQCTRSRDGYYLIEVLLMAVSKKGMELKSIDPNSGFTSLCKLGSASTPVKLLMGTNDGHFVAIHSFNDDAIIFDSLLAKPIKISAEQLVTYVKSRCALMFELVQTLHDSPILHYDAAQLVQNCSFWHLTDSVRLKVCVISIKSRLGQECWTL